MKIRIRPVGSTASRLCFDMDDILDCVLALCSDLDEATNVVGWSELASIGESYETDSFSCVCEG